MSFPVLSSCGVEPAAKRGGAVGDECSKPLPVLKVQVKSVSSSLIDQIKARTLLYLYAESWTAALGQKLPGAWTGMQVLPACAAQAVDMGLSVVAAAAALSK